MAQALWRLAALACSVVLRLLYHAVGVSLVVGVSYVVAYAGWRPAIAAIMRHFFALDVRARGAIEFRVVAWSGWRPTAVQLTVRDAVLFTPATSGQAGGVTIKAWTEQSLECGRVVVQLFATRDAVGLRFEIFDARVTFVTYDTSFSDTNVKRIIGAIAGIRRRRQQRRRDGVHRAKRADLLFNVAAALAISRDGVLDVQVFDDFRVAKRHFADSSLLHASVLFELTDRARETWAPMAEYGSCKATDDIKKAAGDDGWLSTEVRYRETIRLQRRWVLTEVVLVHDIRVKARLCSQATRSERRAQVLSLFNASTLFAPAARESAEGPDDGTAGEYYTTLSPADATIDHLEVRPATFRSQVGLLIWLQQVITKAVASTGLDAVTTAFGAGLDTVHGTVQGATDGVDSIAALVGGPGERVINGGTAGLNAVLGGALDGGRHVVGGIATGGKTAVSALAAGAADGDPTHIVAGALHASHQVVGAAFRGAESLGNGAAFGVGAVLDGVAAGAEYAPVVGDVAAGVTLGAKALVTGVFFGATSVLGGVVRATGAVVAGVADGQLTHGFAEGSELLSRGLHDGVENFGGGFFDGYKSVQAGARNASKNTNLAYDMLNAEATRANAEAIRVHHEVYNTFFPAAAPRTPSR
ncbi:hypothetical protein M885DRAFT_576998 [Pelagophyceae sp. CCMP2097]|nr:hypothetical protein M885DRAFT_576998 [Pelagophyceae sp. CCMP2097]